MQRQIGSIFIVAGTAIGAGMLALPLVLGQFGLPLTILIMFGIWSIMYYVSLVVVELNLQEGHGLTLIQLGKRFSGPVAQSIALICLKVLTFSLLAAYIDGGASIIQKLLLTFTDTQYDIQLIIIFFASVLILLFLFTTRWIDYVNRLLFLALIVSFCLLIIGLLTKIDLVKLPISPIELNFDAWRIALPVVFTSFGYQMVIHSLTTYCKNDKVQLKRVFLWGSLIPTFVYILWTICVLGVLYVEDPIVFQQILMGKAAIGDVILSLSHISNATSIHLFSTITSLLAIFTSIIGVGLGLKDSWKIILIKKIKHPATHSFTSVLITFVPSLLVVLFVQNAFIKALSFGGMISAILAVLLPLYLLRKAKAKNEHYHYPILQYKSLQFIALSVGVIVIICEILNLLQ
ncbi:MAG: aromatic amino acid transport family protein [Alphaproteobacteria bacterium]|nr:aromatic amino acid transport family protein [Alphaproteobacteria bacterium]